MRFTGKILTAIVACLCILTSTVNAEEIQDAEKSVAGSNTAFGIDLYKNLAEDSGNIFFSPYSINLALAMTYAGADGETAKQIKDVFKWKLPDNKLHDAIGKLTDKLPPEDDSEFALNIANSIWGQDGYSFCERYLNILEDDYGAPLRTVAFKSRPEDVRKKINRWVEEKTDDKIKDLMPKGSIDNLTRLVLANAIYFKARWAKTFRENKTTEETFTTAKGEEVETEMMQQTEQFHYMENNCIKLLELPYEGGETSMLIILPHKKNDLPQTEKAFTEKQLDSWMQKLKRHRVSVKLPKFKLKTKFMLQKPEILPAMGMKDAFSPRKANFSHMADEDEQLYISAAIHQAYIDVDEEGTEAAAATGIGVAATAAPLGEPQKFYADRPFIFLIRDRKTNCTLFIGRLANPEN